MRALFRQDDARVIAVCDPMEETDSGGYFGGKTGHGPLKAECEKRYAEENTNYKCNAYQDFRVLLDKEKSIDACVVAAPVHNQALLTISAMKAGKHVYCEKPLAHNVWEVRQVAKVAKEMGVATQMGNHGHSHNALRDACEWIADGAIGAIREVHAWTDTGNWIKHYGLPASVSPPPAGLNWDLWLGVRESRPYSTEYAPFNWRAWFAFGGGSLADMGCHNMDVAVTALKLVAPISVEAVAPQVDEEVASSQAKYVYQFGPRGDMPPVTLTWWDGSKRRPVPTGIDPNDLRQRLGGSDGEGTLFIGEKGLITCEGFAGTPRLLPLELGRTYKRPPQTLARIPHQDHHADWLQACKGGKPASSNFEVGAVLTEIVQLGIVALRSRQQILWDPLNMKATNAPQADVFLREPYRKGWELPV